MERQATSRWASSAPRMRPHPAFLNRQPRLSGRVLTTSILVAALLAGVAKLAPVEWGHVLTGLVIAGGSLPL